MAADPNSVSGSSGTGIGSRKRPMEFRASRRVFQLIEGHHDVGKIAHESARNLGNRDRRSTIHANRTALGIKCSDVFRILAAPRLCVTLGELC